MANKSSPINNGYTIINGAISGSASSKIGCWLEYKVVSQSAADNTSLIRFFIYLANIESSSGYNVYCSNSSGETRGSMNVTANGTTVYIRSKRGFATALIPTAANHTTQFETAYSNSSGTKFLTVLTDNSDTEESSYGEFILRHNADGAGYVTLAWTVDCSYSNSIGTVNGSAKISLPVIPQTTVPTVGNLTLGSTGTITLDPASPAFRHTLRAVFGSAAEETIASQTSETNISWKPSLLYASQAPNATAVTGTLYCDTYSGGVLIGTTQVSITANIPASVAPSAAYSLTDTDGSIAQKFGGFVQSRSKIHAAINASGAYGSTVAAVTTSINDTTYTGTSFDTDYLANSGSQRISITVKDSRARTATVSGTFNVLAYAAPSISGISAYRCNSSGVLSHTGTYVSVTFKSDITSLSNHNDAAVKIWAKKKSETNYTLLRTISGQYSIDSTYIVGGSLSNQYAYDIKIEAIDYFETVAAFVDVSTADTILSIRNNGLGMAIGKISEQNKFEVGWDAEFCEDASFQGDVTFGGDVTFSSLSWMLDLVYPIGSIRMTTSTAGANTFMGGTWVLWGAGKVPVGVNASDSDFSTVEKTGGAKTVSLTTSNMPGHSHGLSNGTVTVESNGSHTHKASSGAYKVGSGSGSTYTYMTNDGSTAGQTTGSGGSHTHTASLSGSTGNAGSGTAHSNLQPYITCYMYKRTA